MLKLFKRFSIFFFVCFVVVALTYTAALVDVVVAVDVKENLRKSLKYLQ